MWTKKKMPQWDYLCSLLRLIFTVPLNFSVGCEIHKQNTCIFLETYLNFFVDSLVLSKCSAGENTSIKFTGNVNLKKRFLSGFFIVKPSPYHTCTSQKWVMYFCRRKWVLYLPDYLCVLLGWILTVWLNFTVGCEIHKNNSCTFLKT